MSRITERQSCSALASRRAGVRVAFEVPSRSRPARSIVFRRARETRQARAIREVAMGAIRHRRRPRCSMKSPRVGPGLSRIEGDRMR